MIFSRIFDKILIFSNPLTYIAFVFLVIHEYANWVLKISQIKNLWFVYFQLKDKEIDGLKRVLQVAKHNFRVSKNRWYKYVFKLTIVKVSNQIRLIK